MASSLPLPAAATLAQGLRARQPASWLPAILLLGVAFGVLPMVGADYLFEAILTPFLALSLAALGLNLLTGLCRSALPGHGRVHGGRRLRRLQS